MHNRADKIKNKIITSYLLNSGTINMVKSESQYLGTWCYFVAIISVKDGVSD